MSKTPAHPDLVASLFATNLDICYECSECSFKLCSTMPPDAKDDCFYRRNGACILPAAQVKSLRHLVTKMSSEIKRIEANVE